ncbi:MAG: ATP-binding protein [Cyclobacteriaceae bacterium]
MSKLIGRISQKKKLEKALKSDKAELIAIYGRRRVGKTFLIRETYKDSIIFELTGLQNGSMRDQLAKFHSVLSALGGQNPAPDSWLEAFQQLSKFISSRRSQKKKVIFIDEFPWLDTRRSKFLMWFEDFWNSDASKRNGLVVVICGSAASYMIKNIVRNTGGLYNRVTCRIRLEPFRLQETKLFLEHKGISYSNYDVLKIYMSIGGIPFYLEQLERGESVAQAIDRMCFMKDGLLRKEFNDIFASIFEHHERHVGIIRMLATSRKGITRGTISQKTGIPSGGRLTISLEELVESGFVEVYPQFNQAKKDSVYRLSDEYSMFYLKFVESSTATGLGTWLNKSNGQSYLSWQGFSFESVCLKHIEYIKYSLGIAAVDSENYSWHEQDKEKGAQIDLLIDRADNVINMCEMKFYNAQYTIDKRYAEDLRNKMTLFKEITKTKKNVFITLMSTYGVKENAYSLELVQKELTIDALFIETQVAKGYN